MDLDAPVFTEIAPRPNIVPTMSISNSTSPPVESSHNVVIDEPVILPESSTLNTPARSQGTVNGPWIRRYLYYYHWTNLFLLFKNTLPLGPSCAASDGRKARFWSLPKAKTFEESSTTETDLSNQSEPDFSNCSYYVINNDFGAKGSTDGTQSEPGAKTSAAISA